MKKIINPCKVLITRRTSQYYNAFAEIEYKDGRLSIHGVVAPRSDGDCIGSCGQCVDDIRGGKPTGNWTDEMLQKFCDIWDKYHLNDMRPYCEHQKTLGWLHENEHPDGILSRACPVCGYKYGTEWKKEEVPQEVIDWLFNLPTTTITPAWV